MPPDRKTPYRPGNDITQSYIDGIVTVFAVSDTAAPGYQPVPAFASRVTLRYQERRLGVSRAYLARQVMSHILRVLRVPRPPPDKMPSPQDIAVTEDGAQYRIDLVQSVPDVFPPSLDLSLAETVQEESV